MVKELMDTLYTRWPAPPPDWLIVDYVRLPVANYKQALEESARDKARIAELEARVAKLEDLVRERV